MRLAAVAVAALVARAALGQTTGIALVNVGVPLKITDLGDYEGKRLHKYNGLTLLKEYVNEEAADPFRLPDGRRISLSLEVEPYFRDSELSNAYDILAHNQGVDMFIGHAEHSDTSSRPEPADVFQVQEAANVTNRLGKIIMFDNMFLPGFEEDHEARFPYAFSVGISVADNLVAGLVTAKAAWDNSSLSLRRPMLAVAVGCENTHRCTVLTTMCQKMRQMGQDLGFDVIGEYQFEDTSLPNAVQQMKLAGPDVFVGCVDAARAVNLAVTARALGFSPKVMLITEGTAQGFVDAVGPANANYILSPTAWDSRREDLSCRIFGDAGGFASAYKNRFGTLPDVLAASAAASGLALLAAVENMGSWPLTAEEIKQGLRNLNLNTFYRKLAFGPNGTLRDARSMVQQVQPLAASLSMLERASGARVEMVDAAGSLPLFPMPNWQDKALEVFPCEAGFVDLDANGSCVGCPAGTHRPPTELDCRGCAVDYYNMEPGQATCLECPVGANCEQGSNVVPPSKVGYYMLPNMKDGLPFYQACEVGVCAGANACFGGNDGVLCASCRAGYTNARLSLKAKTMVCSQCPNAGDTILQILVVAVYLGMVFGFLTHMTLASSTSVRAIRSVILKIFVNYIHMMCTVFAFTWMGRLPVVNFIVDVNLSPMSSLGSLECALSGIGMPQHQVHTIFTLLLVPMALLVIYVAHQVSFFLELRRIRNHAYKYIGAGMEFSEPSAVNAERKSSSTLSGPRQNLQTQRYLAYQEKIIARSRWAIVVVFFLYPAVVRKLLIVVACQELDVMRLRVEQSVQCYTGEHVLWMSLGIFGLVFYGLGIPCAMLIMLYRIKDRLMEVTERKVYGFLYNGFQPQYYYFEVVYMVRKMMFLLIACMPSHVMRTIVMFFLACSFLGIHIRCQPYDNRDFFVLDNLETSSLLALLATLAMNLMYKYSMYGEEPQLTTNLDNGFGRALAGCVQVVVVATHVNVWVLTFWGLLRNSIMRYTHFKAECMPHSVSRFGWLLLKVEPNMNSVAYSAETHRLDLMKLTRRERIFLLRALCDTMEWYIESAGMFHPGRLATCLCMAIELCINERKARARQLCKLICAKGTKRGCMGQISVWAAEARHAMAGRTFKAHESGDDMEALSVGGRKMPRGTKAAVREAVQKVSGPTAVIEELQNALMLCEPHIIMGKGEGKFYEIDKPTCEFVKPAYDGEDENEADVDEAAEGRYVNANSLFGIAGHSLHDPESVGHIGIPVEQAGGFTRAAEVDPKVLRKRKQALAAEARELRQQVDRLQRRLLLQDEEPEAAVPPVEPTVQLGGVAKEKHLVRSTSEADLQEDLKALVEPTAETDETDKMDASRKKDMDEFLASLMEDTAGNYWRYMPSNGASIAIRALPALDSPESGNILKPGASFRASEERAGEDGITFLKLADGRGWVFDQKPGVGVMCRRVDA